MIYALQCLALATGFILVVGLLIAVVDRIGWPDWAGATLGVLSLALLIGVLR